MTRMSILHMNINVHLIWCTRKYPDSIGVRFARHLTNRAYFQSPQLNNPKLACDNDNDNDNASLFHRFRMEKSLFHRCGSFHMTLWLFSVHLLRRPSSSEKVYWQKLIHSHIT